MRAFEQSESKVVRRLKARRDDLHEVGQHYLHFDDALQEAQEAFDEGRNSLARELAHSMTSDDAGRPVDQRRVMVMSDGIDDEG